MRLMTNKTRHNIFIRISCRTSTTNAFRGATADEYRITER